VEKSVGSGGLVIIAITRLHPISARHFPSCFKAVKNGARYWD
jgi:hypothetical protein